MARAHFVTYALDSEGRPISGVSVTVREPDTTTAIAETIYAEDDSAGNTTKANPFTADSDGRVEVWLDNPKIVDLLVTKTGYDDITLRAHISQLDPSTLVLKDAGSSMTQRAGINFLAGFTLTDDAANDETEVALDFGEDGDIADVGTTAAAGSSGEVADASHIHAHPSGLGANLHHAQSHAHDGVDSSGTVAHGDLTGAAADDHHAKAHAHDGADASGTVSHDDLTDVSVNDHHAQAHAINGADHTGTLDDSQIPSTITRDTELTAHAADADAHHDENHDNANHAFRGVLVQRSGQVISTSSGGTEIDFTTEVIDTDGAFDTGVNDSRVIVPAAWNGLYVRARAWTTWAADGVGRRTIHIMHEGTLVGFIVSDSDGLTGDNLRHMAESWVLQVATGDEIYMTVEQTSGGNLSAGQSTFEVEVLGA